jgi:hypothetical protein
MLCVLTEILVCVCAGSTVGIATRYRLDGPGIESRWGRDFPHLSRPALGPTQPPIQRVPSLFPRGKAAGVWHWPPTPSSAEVKDRVELYLYSPSGPSWPVLGWNLPLPLPYQFEGTSCVNPLKTKSRPLYLKTQFVPRCKHFSSRL